ncbi:MAG: hypothetical protein NUV67_00890, partial [archaeon]|nr:hypothetical protein [archaeon]
FFIDIVMNNLLWVFVFYALIHYFLDGKRTIYFFLTLVVLIWAFIDFDSLTGLTWKAAGFLLIYYMSKLAVLAWAENSPRLRNKLLIVSEVQFLALLLIYTFFIR